MSSNSSRSRFVRKLHGALGEATCQALDDPLVVEIMLNPDGRLLVERLGQGIETHGDLYPGAAEIIIGTVAHAFETEADADQPIISGELPIGGHRFEGLLSPAFAAATFTIRRRVSRRIPSDESVRAGIMAHAQATMLRRGYTPMCANLSSTRAISLAAWLMENGKGAIFIHFERANSVPSHTPRGP